tara:strand:- start:356 stop:1039 length:684 start_codon:yes stop_codon:yes gene_type:complete
MASTSNRTGELGGSDSLPTVGIADPLSRQPDVFDYSQSNQFRVYLPIFPTTEWFVVRANIPGVSMSQASQYTPFVDIAVVGDKLQYDNFNMTFMVDEQLKNYMEMYNWVKNIGFPFSGKEQFNALPRPDNIDRGIGQKLGVRRFKDSYKDPLENEVFEKKNDRNLYTDILMTILTSKNNPIANITLYEAFPISLGNIEYSQQESDTDYATCEVSFAFSWFDVAPSIA